MAGRIAPHPDQIEVSVFGPGFGECIVVHIGNDNWIIVDSCVDDATKSPAALDYLAAIGSDVSQSVRLLVATHWHDDHVSGIAKVLQAAKSAQFCSSVAMRTKDFYRLAAGAGVWSSIKIGSGVSEMHRVLEILKTRQGAPLPKAVIGGSIVADFAATQIGIAGGCSVLALSPSSAEFQDFLLHLATLIPPEDEVLRRVPDPGANDVSVALWITIGGQGVLLGADLEVKSDPAYGWEPVIKLPGRPQLTASVFKIPHHGSKNGHYLPVWSTLLAANAYSALTPWQLGAGRLPTDADLLRIRQHTSNAFTTNSHTPVAGVSRPYAVEKTIRETVGKIVPLSRPMGRVTFRNGGAASPATWTVSLDGPAAAI